jgi:hypothetical protein
LTVPTVLATVVNTDVGVGREDMVLRTAQQAVSDGMPVCRAKEYWQQMHTACIETFEAG